MEQDFSRGHLEELLRERTEEYNMYPTERVWNGIYHRLHTRRKWHFIGAGTFALMILAGVFVLVQDNTTRKVSKPGTALSDLKSAPKQYTVSVGKLSLNNQPASTLQSKLAAHFDPTLSTIGQDQGVDDASAETEVESGTNGSAELAGITGSQSTTGATSAIGTADRETLATALLPGKDATADITAGEDQRGTVTNNSHIAGVSADAHILPLGTIKNDPLAAGSLRDNALAMAAGQKSLLPAHGLSRLSWLFHFEPSVSFRSLKSKTAIKTNYGVGFIIVDNNGYDINGLVDQRPSVGFELGSDLLYSLTSRLRLKAGLQFNYSRYTAQAYTTNTPQTTTITLGGPGTGIPASQVATSTQYENAGRGSLNTTWIPDQRVEISLPVGAEFQIMHDQNVSWNVAGSVQPTYILNAKAFLLSTDYEHYVQDPNLIRRWNMNVAAETFLRINKGKVQLQIGPQIRYQLQPSFISSYPIKEHLYDIGFKIGVTQSIR